MSGSAIATQIAAAASEIARDAGNGANVATITRTGPPTGPEYDPTPGASVAFAVPILTDSNISIRDAGGTLTGEIRRVLSLVATVIVPLKGDTIAVGGVDHVITEVVPLSPAGVDLMYRVTLER